MLNFTTICQIVGNSSYHAPRTNVSRNAFLNSRSEGKKTFSLTFIPGKNKPKKDLSWSVLLSTMATLHYFFSQTMLSYCFGMLSEFANFFERKMWRVQVAHLHNVGVGVFNCQQILTQIYFVIFNVVVKNKSNVV